MLGLNLRARRARAVMVSTVIAAVAMCGAASSSPFESALEQGRHLIEQNQCNKAISYLDQAIKLNPKSGEAYTNRARAYSCLRNYQRALSDANKAIDFAPKLALAYYSRGSAYAGLGQEQAAIKDYTKAIELDPKFATAYSNRALAYEKLGKSELAKKERDVAAELQPRKASSASIAVGVGMMFVLACASFFGWKALTSRRRREESPGEEATLK